ncbi:MAG: uracil-DNA glycosylase family protein [Sphingomonadaceae bacterium]
MMAGRQPEISEEIASALDWWRSAGVDYDYHDEITDWLAADTDPVAQASKPAVKSASRREDSSLSTTSENSAIANSTIGGNPANWPDTASDFGKWWLEEPSLDHGGLGSRIPPRGKTSQPDLMIIVEEPETEDQDKLLSGPQGRLLSNMLAAMDIPEENIYLTAVLPRKVPMADFVALGQAGLGKITRHHVDLIAPVRILTFGRNILPLIGHDAAQRSAVLRDFYHDTSSVPLLGTGSLGNLLRQPGRRAQFWRAWLDWNTSG